MVHSPPDTASLKASDAGDADAHAEADFLVQAYTRLRQAVADRAASPVAAGVLPSADSLSACLASLPCPSSPSYLAPLGPSRTHAHLLDAVLPALNHQSLSPRYLGFVTGGVLPVAEAADNLVSALDQNVQVHFPLPQPQQPWTWTHSASTAVEDAALRMLAALLGLDGVAWAGRTFTTGATASNVLGLACAREAVLRRRGGGEASAKTSVAEVGLAEACRAAGVRGIQVLSSMAHSSLGKAASVVGLGRSSVRDVGRAAEPWRLDLDAVERELKIAGEEGVASIVVVSAGEVNTGRFATDGLDMARLRSLADEYGAWIHVDAGGQPRSTRSLPVMLGDIDESRSLWPLCPCPAQEGRISQSACERCRLGTR